MFVTALMGSPRKEGNTAFLVKNLLKALAERGAEAAVLESESLRVNPCRSCGFCEKKGVCTQKDDMETAVFPLLKKAELLVIGTPVYFYNVPGPMKTVFDRCQTLWARKYLLHLHDPLERWRKGVLLAQGATSGKNLFDGISLTVSYTLDAVGAELSESLCYREIENIGDMAGHPAVRDEIEAAAERITASYNGLSRVLVLSRADAFYGPIVAAYVNRFSGGSLIAHHAGLQPAAAVEKDAVMQLERRGLDIKFQSPRGLNDVLSGNSYDTVISIDNTRPGREWAGPDQAVIDLPIREGNQNREAEIDAIENRVDSLVRELQSRRGGAEGRGG